MDHFLNLMGGIPTQDFQYGVQTRNIDVIMTSYYANLLVQKDFFSPVRAGEWILRTLTSKRDLILNKIVTLNKIEIYGIYGCPVGTLLWDRKYGTLGVPPGRMACMFLNPIHSELDTSAN